MEKQHLQQLSQKFWLLFRLRLFARLCKKKKPILLAIDGVSRELVNKAACGVYVEPENTTAIVIGVKQLLQLNDKDIKEMGINGYNYAKENFDRSFLAKKYIAKIETNI